MLTLIAKLCSLCAASAMIQIMLGDHESSGIIRSLCGLLMLHMTLSELVKIGSKVVSQDSLIGMFQALIG